MRLQPLLLHLRQSEKCLGQAHPAHAIPGRDASHSTSPQVRQRSRSRTLRDPQVLRASRESAWWRRVYRSTPSL